MQEASQQHGDSGSAVQSRMLAAPAGLPSSLVFLLAALLAGLLADTLAGPWLRHGPSAVGRWS
jgi:hypothetical protein